MSRVVLVFLLWVFCQWKKTKWIFVGKHFRLQIMSTLWKGKFRSFICKKCSFIINLYNVLFKQSVVSEEVGCRVQSVRVIMKWHHCVNFLCRSDELISLEAIPRSSALSSLCQMLYYWFCDVIFKHSFKLDVIKWMNMPCLNFMLNSCGVSL